VLWLTATEVFAVKLSRLCEIVVTRLLTVAATDVLTLAAAQLDVVMTLVDQQQLFLLQPLSNQLRKPLQLQLLQLNLRLSSLQSFTSRRRARAAWLVCSEWPDNQVDLRWERTASCSNST
jgi:hypothetical protein